MNKKLYIWIVILSCLTLEKLSSQGNKVFTIPLSDLKDWSEKIIVKMDNVTIKGHSGVHLLDDDCEMHFGATLENYQGDPPGIVIEPMNVCIKPFFEKVSYVKKDWTDFAKSLVNKKVSVEGVPRIWPEHLEGENKPSNPNHALEIHPLTKLKTTNKTYDFSKFVFAPEGYWGGLDYVKAQSILEKIEVGVTTENEIVEVDFYAGRIGNFTALEIEFYLDSIFLMDGGHLIEGKVILAEDEYVYTYFITTNGSPINNRMSQWQTGNKIKIAIEALVLFSLSPQSLYNAAIKSLEAQERVTVEKPVQFIVYGVPSD